MAAKPLVQAEVDVSRNLLRTHYRGTPSVADFKAGVSTIRDAVDQLKPGFTVLSDWSQIESMDLDCVPSITEIMDLARAKGAALIVRVLPRPEKDIGINILSVVHLRGSARTVTADNLEEAERLVH